MGRFIFPPGSTGRFDAGQLEQRPLSPVGLKQILSWELMSFVLACRANYQGDPVVVEVVLGESFQPYWPPSGFFSGGFSSFLGSVPGNGGGAVGFESGAAPVWGGFSVSSFFGSSFFSTSRSFRSFNTGSTVHLE